MDENPYQSPTAASGEKLSSHRFELSIRPALFVTVCGIVGAFLGGTIGFTLGLVVPGYYRSVFSNGNEPYFDPVAVGVGQGVTQGFGGGVCVGVLLVGITYFLQYRSGKLKD